MDIKELVLVELCQLIKSIEVNEIKNSLTYSSDIKNGDICFPCFALAKVMHNSPIAIANLVVKEINDNLKTNNIIDYAEAINGYVNIFTKKHIMSKNIVSEILENANDYGKNNFGCNKTIVLDYSSVNLAKYMHIGHLKTTIIGTMLKNLYENFGYKTVSINYVGDYGTPFGKMITAYKLWGNHDDVATRGVDAVQDLYVRFNKEAETNPALEDSAREWFRKIENGDSEAIALQQWFIELSRNEVERLCNLLGAKFDSWRGENYYSDKMQPVIEELEQHNLIKTSEGARVVDLSEFGLGVALVQKSDGTSLYLTRDLAAVNDRYTNFNFDKAIYVTDIAQKLHFSQLFKIIELLKKPYAGNLEHVAYGRYSLPTGKISSRLGKQALLSDIFDAAVQKSLEIMNERGTKVEDINSVSKKVAVGAISFEALKYERVKDTVFDLNESLNFDGETSPYMQYTYARCCSIMEKANTKINLSELCFENENEGFELIKLLNKYPIVLMDSYNKLEPCLVVRHLMSICSELNKFYNSNRIIDNNIVNLERLSIVLATKQVLENGFCIINIPPINKM